MLITSTFFILIKLTLQCSTFDVAIMRKVYWVIIIEFGSSAL